MLYFKKLLQTRDYLFNEVNASDFSEQEKFVWDKQKEIITEICTFVFSFNWLQQKKAKDFMKEAVRCDFNYEELISRTGRPYTSIRVTISTRSSEAERLVGINTLDLLMKGNYVEAYSEFMISSSQKSFDSYVLQGVKELLPKPEYDPSVKLSECEAELKFLKAVGVENFKGKLKSLDEDKLKCLLAILSDEGYYMSIYRNQIWQYLLGGLVFRGLMDILKEQN